jgi:hypothetical protein
MMYKAVVVKRNTIGNHRLAFFDSNKRPLMSPDSLPQRCQSVMRAAPEGLTEAEEVSLICGRIILGVAGGAHPELLPWHPATAAELKDSILWELRRSGLRPVPRECHNEAMILAVRPGEPDPDDLSLCLLDTGGTVVDQCTLSWLDVPAMDESVRRLGELLHNRAVVIYGARQMEPTLRPALERAGLIFDLRGLRSRTGANDQDLQQAASSLLGPYLGAVTGGATGVLQDALALSALWAQDDVDLAQAGACLRNGRLG